MIRTILFAAGILLFSASCKKSSEEGTTPGGFKYMHHVKTEGALPKAGDYVYFQVVMTNGDSTLFDSYSQPDLPMVVIPTPEETAGQRPSPVLEALMLMAVGDSLTVYYPVDSLGPQRPAGFENAEFVVYNIAMKEIKGADAFKAAQAAEKKAEAEAAVPQDIRDQTKSLMDEFKANTLGDRLVTTASGLQYVLIQEGTGAVAKAGETVTAQYYGLLMDETVFDFSYPGETPFSFPAGQGRVIPGWDEAFTTLKAGSKALLFIPSALGYGAQGNDVIPANSDLVFFVEVLGVTSQEKSAPKGK